MLRERTNVQAEESAYPNEFEFITTTSLQNATTSRCAIIVAVSGDGEITTVLSHAWDRARNILEVANLVDS